MFFGGHSYDVWNRPAEGYRGANILFTMSPQDALVPKLPPRASPDFIYLPHTLDTRSHPNLRLMMEEIIYLAASTSTLNRARSAVLLPYFLVEWAACGPQAAIESSAMIDTAISYIERNPTQNPSLDELANRTKLSRSTFVRKFRAATGKSAKAFIIDTKLRMAISIFATDPAVKIRELAFSLGFSDEFYFSRLFKSKTGLSPRQYRRKKGL